MMTTIRMTTIFVQLCCLSIVCVAMGDSTQAEPPTQERAHILLVTGEDYPGHQWKKTFPVLKGELEKDARLTVDVLSDLTSLVNAPLADYDAVVLHFKNYDPQVPGRAAYEKLVQFVEQGGGLMLVHFSCGAFEEFKDEFVKVVGRVWFGLEPPAGRRQHDPHGVFTVNIANHNHPITKGMQDFTTVDELYTCLEGDAPITVLASAVSKIDNQPYPIAFQFQYGQGRVFQSLLGHDTDAFAARGPAELHRRGCAWVAGLKPVSDEP